MNEREQFKANMENGSVQAWLDGTQIEYLSGGEWFMAIENPVAALARCSCRVKQKPVEVWAVVGASKELTFVHDTESGAKEFQRLNGGRVVRCVEQPE